jgi:hypothetical protein
LHQPFDRAQFLPALNSLTIQSLALLLIPTARILRAWTQTSSDLRDFLITQKTPLLVLIGIFLAPAALLGRIKVGGNDNSLALSLSSSRSPLLRRFQHCVSGRSPIFRGSMK